MNFLFQKVDSKTLAILRIAIGAWFFVECVGMMLIGWMQDAYIHSKLNFPFWGFEWIPRLPPAGMYAIFVVLSIAALGIMLGYRYKLAVAIFFSCFLYVFMLDIVYNLNKFYLFLILCFLLLFLDAHSLWSMDVKSGRIEKKKYVPRWNILVFQGLIAIIYFYAGIAKINPDWIFHAEPLRTFLGRRGLAELIGPEAFEVAIYIFSIVGLIFDLSVAFLLIFRRTNFLGNIAQGSFHSLNFIFLGIGTLSIFTALSTWLLFPTKWLKRRLKLIDYQGELIEVNDSVKRNTSILLGLFFLIHLSIPHRHYLTGNNVNWTEKGHRFSWRLMTRTKSGSQSTFYVKDKVSGQRWKVDPSTYLTRRQYRKMSAETDLVLVFAYYLKSEWEKKGYQDVAVTAKILTRLNGRAPQYLVDPDMDLTKCSRSFLVDNISSKLNPRKEK